jgi:3-phenylpropionate/trans-cinnamate dioxygenase alpha subunit
MEIWSWCIVDKNAPSEVKDANRVSYLQSFSPAGITEEGDMENWGQATAASRGRVAKQFDYNYQLSIGHERRSEEFPGSLGPRVSEHNHRHFYTRWADLMAGRTWDEMGDSL